MTDQKHSHYKKDVSKLDVIDVYRVLSLWEVTDPCIQHAVKKLLVAGGRGAKDFDKDIQEAIDSLRRLQVMRKEDTSPAPVGTTKTIAPWDKNFPTFDSVEQRLSKVERDNHSLRMSVTANDSRIVKIAGDIEALRMAINVMNMPK